MTARKPLKTDESRAPYGNGANRTPVSTDARERSIRAEESNAVAARIQEVIGAEAGAEFARRSGIPEATLRSYVNDGRMPPLDRAKAIADAGGVLVDWLATGRSPKTRADLKALQDAASRPAGQAAPDPERLRLALTMAEDTAALVPEGLTPERRAELALAFYQRLATAPPDTA